MRHLRRRPGAAGFRWPNRRERIGGAFQMLAASGLLARTATNCLDQALFFAEIADRSSGGIESGCQRCIGHAAPDPNRVDEVVLAGNALPWLPQAHGCRREWRTSEGSLTALGLRYRPLRADAAIGVSSRDATRTSMTASEPIDRPSVAKPVSRRRSAKPATVSTSSLAPHRDCSRAHVAKLEAEGVLQRQRDGFPLDQSRVDYLR